MLIPPCNEFVSFFSRDLSVHETVFIVFRLTTIAKVVVFPKVVYAVPITEYVFTIPMSIGAETFSKVISDMHVEFPPRYANTARIIRHVHLL